MNVANSSAPQPWPADELKLAFGTCIHPDDPSKNFPYGSVSLTPSKLLNHYMSASCFEQCCVATIQTFLRIAVTVQGGRRQA
jgi:hypothetical protein